MAPSFKGVIAVFPKIGIDISGDHQKLLWLTYINFFFQGKKEHLHVRHTSYLCAMEISCLRMSSLAPFHLSLFLAWCSRVCATGKMAPKVSVSPSPGSSLKRPQRRLPPCSNPAPLGYYSWLDPTLVTTCFPSPTRPYNSLPYTQTLQYSSAELDRQLHSDCKVT